MLSDQGGGARLTVSTKTADRGFVLVLLLASTRMCIYLVDTHQPLLVAVDAFLQVCFLKVELGEVVLVLLLALLVLLDLCSIPKRMLHVDITTFMCYATPAALQALLTTKPAAVPSTRQLTSLDQLQLPAQVLGGSADVRRCLV